MFQRRIFRNAISHGTAITGNALQGRHKYLSKSFLYIFFSVKGGETRVFPSRAAGHSGEKKPGFFTGQISKTYG
ncbi:Uncharacterized protein dnm_080080 [Desulfonema magnum]|uniref:Uncharacterized protein n=1 Tax=Desulfonema magnum TaxID=45655 RepID=A0A975GSD2_9BACT|nr:Uncharacterized protein dnm_080080 [Desulfonema magnum]